MLHWHWWSLMSNLFNKATSFCSFVIQFVLQVQHIKAKLRWLELSLISGKNQSQAWIQVWGRLYLSLANLTRGRTFYMSMRNVKLGSAWLIDRRKSGWIWIPIVPPRMRSRFGLNQNLMPPTCISVNSGDPFRIQLKLGSIKTCPNPSKFHCTRPRWVALSQISQF